jgi:serine/threonine protein kinase
VLSLHADIKPANILRVYGEFKLADFGFAKFWKLGEEARFDGGTPMYGEWYFSTLPKGMI